MTEKAKKMTEASASVCLILATALAISRLVQ